ncbi:MAG TPA: amidohydrolase [Streptosporangiaceae bacterium]|nr:amidohydrolase [Streptosporangiaceae bacterium]
MSVEGEYSPVLYRAAVVHTQAGAPAGCLAVAGGRVAATGTFRELRDRYPGAAVTDLGDAVVVPGFNDAHQHLTQMAGDLLGTDLGPGAVRGRGEIMAALRRGLAAAPDGGWVRATRYDPQKSSGGELLTRDDLDEVSASQPIVVCHVAGHWGVVNSAALRMAGLRDDSPDPPGGRLGRDGAGRLNGVVYERAFFPFSYPPLAGDGTLIPALSPEDRLRGLDAAQSMLLAAGLTSVTDALVGPDDLALLAEARRRGRLRLRVSALLSYRYIGELAALGVGTGFGDEWLRIGGIKAFVDGACGGRTCLVDEPFEGSDDHGIQTTPTGELGRIVDEVHRRGWRICVHANGDRAITLLLGCLEAARRRWPGGGTAHRIEHCTIVTPQILERMKALGAVAVPFGGYVRFHGAKLRDWYGAPRLERMFAHRWFLDAGITVAGSSDYPCGPFEPLYGMQSCVTRRGADGELLGPSQRITPAEALRLYTAGSAEASGEASLKGRLVPGQLADFTVLGADPLAVPADDIAAIPVLATYVAGQRAWPAAGAAGPEGSSG